MQRKIGYGLIGASLTLLFLISAGFAWRVAVQATEPALEPIPVSIDIDLMPEIDEQEIFVATDISSAPEFVEKHSPILSTTSDDETSQMVATLPQNTNDPHLVIAAVQFLASQEQAKFSHNSTKWYQLETATWWPQEPVIMNSGNGIQIESEKLIVEDATHSTFLRYGLDGEVDEGLSVYRDATTNEIRQFAFLEGNSWVNVTLRNMGFTSNEFVVPVTNGDFGQFPIEDVLEQLISSFQQAPKETNLWAYQQDNQFVVHLTFTYSQPQQFVEASDLVVSTEKIIWFDTQTGQLLGEQAFSHLQNGLVEMNYRYTLLKQQSIDTLPDDVHSLYKASVGE